MPNFNCDLIIKTNASNVYVGAVLMQHDRPVAFISKALNFVQYNYHTTDYELLAIVLICRRWHQYLYDKKTTVYKFQHKSKRVL